MDLERNICDTIKEWEIKIGYCRQNMELYYPESSLMELTGVKKEELKEALNSFCRTVKEKLGDLVIYETREKGRYCIHIPAKGVEYVHKTVKENLFLPAFLKIIKTPSSTLLEAEIVFRSFDKNVLIEKRKEDEWAFWFSNEKIDPYVYFVEQDEFGLQYHRFTKQSYKMLFS